MKIKQWPNKVRRFFSLNKKQLKKDKNGEDDKDGNDGGGVKEKTLPWSPDDIFDEFHGISPIPSEMKGHVLLVEVGGGDVDQGWVLDFSGNYSKDEVIVARYDLPPSRLKSRKAPSLPPPGMYNTFELKTLPWIWYKDLKVFSKIETGKLSDMVAFVTGRIAVSGEMKPWEGLDASWKEAKDRVAEKRKLDGSGSTDEQEEEEDEDEEDIDEEARIIATYKPAVEPKNPLKKEFWKRHIGTDFLVASYLFLISSVAYMSFAITQCVKEVSAHSIADAFASVLFTVGAIYFIKLSYPETIMLMAYRVMSIDPNDMTFFQRYFVANEMLVALWLFTAGFVLPYLVVILYELFTEQFHKAAVDTVTIFVALPLTAVFNVSAMPDAMRANNGRGSSFFFDYFWVHLMCLKRVRGDVEESSSSSSTSIRSAERYAFWVKHVGNDGLAGAWIFATLGVVCGLGVLPLVILKPLSPNTWLLFWSIMPFSVGSVLLVRASYPEYMNKSMFFLDDSEEEKDGKTISLIEATSRSSLL